MNTENAITSRHDDVVFENRNKLYGAYVIRKSYDLNLSKGSLGSLLFMAFIFLTIQYAMMKTQKITEAIGRTFPPIKIDPNIHIIPDRPSPPIKSTVTQASLFPTRIVTHEVDDVPIIENPTPTSTGDANGTPSDIPSDGNEGVEIPTSTSAVVEPVPLVDRAEVMPEFVGGEKALYKFLRKTLRYPNAAKQIGQEGTVFVRFIIDVTGEVTGIEVLRGASGTLDKEASRVISLMPRWKPGMQHGNAVNVRMVLPIKFALGE